MVTVNKIYRDPVFGREYFSRKNNGSLPFPLQEKNLILFGYARVALYEGLRILGIKDGDAVLVPNYICNVVAAPMHSLNIKIKFYPVDLNLKPQWDIIDKAIDKNTKALLVVNYFGFPNDLTAARDFCKKHNLYMIEDNAHGFLSADKEKPLGSYGDISIFSFRKILPIPNGAGLLINNKLLLNRLPKITYLRKRNRTLRFMVKNLLISLRDALANTGLKEEDFEGGRIKDISEEYNLPKYFIKFSRLSKFVINYINFDNIIVQRRNSYDGWLGYFAKEHTSGLKVVFPLLQANCVPFNFPVLIENQKGFLAGMCRKGIGCYPWPYLPESSNEDYLTPRLVCLPVFPFSKLNNFFKNG